MSQNCVKPLSDDAVYVPCALCIHTGKLKPKVLQGSLRSIQSISTGPRLMNKRTMFFAC